jgi:2'-5' RNA ligase
VIRSFIAIDIAPATIEKIATAIEQLKPRIPGIRWTAPSNFHFTLKFLGDIEESQIDSIGNALLRELHPFPRFTINAKGLGVFPGPRRPRILWVGLAGVELARLAAKVETALEPLGFAPEQRTFTPHLTIGRWRQFDRAPDNLRQDLENWKYFEFGESSVDEVILFQSMLKPEGAIYSRLKIIKLKDE